MSATVLGAASAPSAPPRPLPPSQPLRVVFAGTPEFARVALEQILAAGHSVPLVLTQPDRPAGRGMKLQASAVKHCALAHGLALAQPTSLRLDGKSPDEARAAQAAILGAAPDLLVVAAYGLLLPPWLLALPRLGCLNIHASLLPRWRGAAPIHRAIEAGDAHTGVTIMQMDAGLDTGDMLLSATLAIEPSDTTADLHDRLARLGAELISEALARATQPSPAGLRPTPQPSEGITYAHKIEKSEAALDWSQSAQQIDQRIRAFNPFPGASAQLAGETLKLWGCALVRASDDLECYEINSKQTSIHMRYGTILSTDNTGIIVQCGQGQLRLTELQRAGAKRLSAADFLRGCALQPGMVFGP